MSLISKPSSSADHEEVSHGIKDYLPACTSIGTKYARYILCSISLAFLASAVSLTENDRKILLQKEQAAWTPCILQVVENLSRIEPLTQVISRATAARAPLYSGGDKLVNGLACFC